jgi:hypothetical protein
MGLVQANPSRPRRAVRPFIAAAIDLTVTPPAAGSSAGQIGAGEMCYLTGNNKVASLNTLGSSNANAADFVGVSNDVYPVAFTDGIVGSPIPPSDSNLPMVNLFEDGDHLFKTTAAETYEPYAAVYLGADGRTISTVATGTSVGYVSPDQRQSPGVSQLTPFPITGAAGVLIYIRIQPALVKGN